MVTETDRNKARSAVVSAYHALDCVTIPFSFLHAFADAAVDAVSMDAEPVAWVDPQSLLAAPHNLDAGTKTDQRTMPLYAEPVKTDPAVAVKALKAWEAWEAKLILEGSDDLWEELGDLTDLQALRNAALSAQVQEVAVERYRHKKRGSTYTVIARGRLQVDGDLDNEGVVIYRGDDGQTWVRPEYEFHDGRFEAVTASPASKHGDAE